MEISRCPTWGERVRPREERERSHFVVKCIGKYRCSDVPIYRFTDLPMYRCVDVWKMVRFIKENGTFWGGVVTRIKRGYCPDGLARERKLTFVAILVYRCTDLPIYRCSDVPIYRFTDLPMYRCVDVSVYRCIDVSVYRCIDVSMYRYIGKSVNRYIATSENR